MTPYKPQPADPLDLAILFATLALTLCPDSVRQAMIALLDEQITFLDEYRFDQLLQDLQKLDALPPELLDTLDIPPAITRWLRATSDHRIQAAIDELALEWNQPTPLLLPPGGLQDEPG